METGTSALCVDSGSTNGESPRQHKPRRYGWAKCILHVSLVTCLGLFFVVPAIVLTWNELWNEVPLFAPMFSGLEFCCGTYGLALLYQVFIRDQANNATSRNGYQYFCVLSQSFCTSLLIKKDHQLQGDVATILWIGLLIGLQWVLTMGGNILEGTWEPFHDKETPWEIMADTALIIVLLTVVVISSVVACVSIGWLYARFSYLLLAQIQQWRKLQEEDNASSPWFHMIQSLSYLLWRSVLLLAMVAILSATTPFLTVWLSFFIRLSGVGTMLVFFVQWLLGWERQRQQQQQQLTQHNEMYSRITE